MRLIDADALYLRMVGHGWWNNTDRDIALDVLERMPTIAPESLRPRGGWIKNEDGVPACTNCNRTALLDGSEDYVLSEFCPHCGAKMEETLYA